MSIEKIGIIGMGAVGVVYAKEFLKSYGDNFYAVLSKERAEKVKHCGFKINSDTIHPNVILTDGSANFKLDLLMVCVKNYHLEQCFDEIMNVIDENTIILPILSGITATDRLKNRFPNNKVLYGSVFLTSERIDGVVYSSDRGLLKFGERENINYSDAVISVKEVFEKSEIPYRIPKDMIYDQWKKWLINIGANPISAIVGESFSRFREFEELQNVMCKSMLEVIDVAQAVGVNLLSEDVEFFIERVRTFAHQGRLKTSTLQDIENKRQTEIEYFGGDLIRIAKRVGVEVPVNETLYNIVKAIEKLY